MQEDYRKEDEIDLLELLQVLWKRKVLILGGTFLLTALAAVVAFLLPPVYEVTAILEPGKRPISDGSGQVVEEKVVESAVSIRETILGGTYNEVISREMGIPVSEFPEISVSVPKNTDLVTIAVESTEPQRAVEIVSRIVSLVSERMAEKIDRERQRIENEILLAEIDVKSSEDRHALLLKQVDAVQETIGTLQAEKQKAFARDRNDAMAILLYGNEIQNQQIYLNRLQEEVQQATAAGQKAGARLENFRKKLGAIHEATVYKNPSVPEKPVKPQKKIIVGFAFCVGFLGLCLMTFLLEAVRIRGEKDLKASMGNEDDGPEQEALPSIAKA